MYTLEVLNIAKYIKYPIKDLELLGRGTQGSVYKIDEHKCIKIFKKTNACRDELHSMLISQIDSHFPSLYEYGDDYIVREYIHGFTLDSYITENSFTEEIANKIIELYKAMYFVGFKRLDFALFHAFLVFDNQSNAFNIMLIDTAKAMKKNYSYPSILINSLNKLNCSNQFLDYVRTNYPQIYNKWSMEKHILH